MLFNANRLLHRLNFGTSGNIVQIGNGCFDKFLKCRTEFLFTHIKIRLKAYLFLAKQYVCLKINFAELRITLRHRIGCNKITNKDNSLIALHAQEIDSFRNSTISEFFFIFIQKYFIAFQVLLRFETNKRLIARLHIQKRDFAVYRIKV